MGIVVLTAMIFITGIVISRDSREKPNSQVNNPAVYNNVKRDAGYRRIGLDQNRYAHPRQGQGFGLCLPVIDGAR
jgi:hypothetical protein